MRPARITSLAPASPVRRAPRLASMLLFLLVLLPICGCGSGASTGSAGSSTSAGAGGTVASTSSAVVPGPFRHPVELEQVQAAIERQGAQWTAEETEVSESNADLQDRAEVNGDIESEPGEPAGDEAPTVSTSRGPSVLATTSRASVTAINWRNKDGIDWTTPSMAQQDFGTCVAFAAIGAFESQVKIAKGDSSLSVALSEWCLWCEGTGQQNPKPGGWSSGKAAKWLQDTGTVTRADCAYAPLLYASFSSPLSPVTRYKITGYKWVEGADGIKTALASGPVVGSMIVYPDFDNFYGQGIYEHVLTGNPKIDDYDRSATVAHAILIVGYDDTARCWVCKNSNGPNWGEYGGFCRLKYGAIGGITEANGAYQYTVDKSIAYP